MGGIIGQVGNILSAVTHHHPEAPPPPASPPATSRSSLASDSSSTGNGGGERSSVPLPPQRHDSFPWGDLVSSLPGLLSNLPHFSGGGGDSGGDSGDDCDPLVFDLNHDGHTDATASQHGIDVDGATDTRWAARGDGVLAFGDKPIGTDGGRFQDAYATLRAKAEAAGIDTAKGYLDAQDLHRLEAEGLTMLVSQGDGSNRSARPTAIGITRIDLSGHATQRRDAAGNRVSAEGAFTQAGQVHEVDDVWLRRTA
ncbi:MAG: hypothetical protein JWM80_2465 [Cyanobacteria bacterium RYN_339]|nr:hypothetical protein [Cyanobacteria bacterium RYN_339]